MDATEILRQLVQLDTASLCDADKALNINMRVMDGGMRPIQRGVKMAGRAHTVRCYNDFLTVIKGLADAHPGDVLVIDSQNSTKALTGELFPTEAQRKGLAGIVNDGPCRDTATVRTLKFPYYARSICCIPGTTNRLFETQIPISCGGVVVHPGDLLLGDDDGIIVGSAHQFAQLIPVAQAVQAKEDRLLSRMNDGVSLLDMINFDDHCENVRNGRPSTLEFKV